MFLSQLEMAAGEVFPSNHGGSTNAMKKRVWTQCALHANFTASTILSIMLSFQGQKVATGFRFCCFQNFETFDIIDALCTTIDKNGVGGLLKRGKAFLFFGTYPKLSSSARWLKILLKASLNKTFTFKIFLLIFKYCAWFYTLLDRNASVAQNVVAKGHYIPED